MPLMTPFHHSQFNSPVLVEVGQLILYTFANVSKIRDSSSLQVQKTRAIMSHVAVMCQIHERLVEGEFWAEVTGVTIWGHIKILPCMCQVI